FKGYLEDEHNRGIWPKQGWFNTGDLGRCDAEGYFWLTGRSKDLIIRGGHNIDPATIEEPLYRFDGIKVAAAVGRPDPYAGEVPVAYVQPQEGTTLDPQVILEYLKAEIGERAAIPKAVFIVEDMPLTPVGKIFKPALRWNAVKRVYQAELQALGEMAESVEVEVGEDKVHGVLATIKIKASAAFEMQKIVDKVRDILASYTVKYRVLFQ
ncbi:MAG TPA: acyl-CoA synthetase, partial [Desulfobacteraceae bacterium]|nr:acyl-CoA synthetase [Desulfobacteraceae bacterium]